MSEPLPNCPLCGGVIAYMQGSSAEYGHQKHSSCELVTLFLSLHQWRAIAALRKPLTEQEADKLVWDHRMASEEAIAYEGSHEYWVAANAAGDAIRAALTGKR